MNHPTKIVICDSADNKNAILMSGKRVSLAVVGKYPESLRKSLNQETIPSKFGNTPMFIMDKPDILHVEGFSVVYGDSSDKCIELIDSIPSLGGSKICLAKGSPSPALTKRVKEWGGEVVEILDGYCSVITSFMGKMDIKVVAEGVKAAPAKKVSKPKKVDPVPEAAPSVG
jgi:hypothetical protein